MKKQVLLLIAFTLLTMTISLSACSKDTENQLGIDGYVYVAEKIELQQFDKGSVSNIKVYDDTLYFYNDDVLYRFPLESGAEEEKRAKAFLRAPSDENLRDYVMDEENGIYYFVQSYSISSTTYELLTNGGTLYGRSPDGSIKYQLSMPKANISLQTSNALVVNDLKQVFLLTDDSIYVIDEEGNIVASLSTEDYQQDWRDKENLFVGAEGKIYYCQESYELYEEPKLVYEVIWDGTLRLNKLEGLSAKNRGSFFSSQYGLLYKYPDGYLYQCGAAEDASFVPLLTWSDSDLPNSASEIFQISDDRIVALCEGYGEWEGEGVYLLSKTAVKDLPKKEIIVLASIGPSQTLQYSISDFNRENDRYHITLKTYVGEEDGIMRLDASMVSSSPPDLLDMTGLDVLKYAEKHGLEDLSPYLEKSTVLNKDDFLESVFESYTVKGRLVSIPSQFRLISLMGRASQVGEEAGWTMEDMMELTERFPDSRLTLPRTFEFILRRVLSEFILEEYIDWETGECRFDSEEFRELMRWMEKNYRGISYNDGLEDEYQHPNESVPEDVLLLWDRNWSFMDYLRCDAMLDGERSMIGFPTPDGSPRYLAEPVDTLGIVSRSSHKEGAWEFLEYFLLNTPYNYFPSRRDLLLQEAEEATTINYGRDENGEILILQSKDGPVPDMHIKSDFLLNGEWFYVYSMTEEQADTVLEAIDHMSFILNGGTREQVINIILEEMAPYLKGDKTLEEATSIIQNRLTVLVNESL